MRIESNIDEYYSKLFEYIRKYLGISSKHFFKLFFSDFDAYAYWRADEWASWQKEQEEVALQERAERLAQQAQQAADHRLTESLLKAVQEHQEDWQKMQQVSQNDVKEEDEKDTRKSSGSKKAWLEGGTKRKHAVTTKIYHVGFEVPSSKLT